MQRGVSHAHTRGSKMEEVNEGMLNHSRLDPRCFRSTGRKMRQVTSCAASPFATEDTKQEGPVTGVASITE